MEIMNKHHQYTTLREILIETRRTQGLTQVEIANRLGKPQSFVSKYESGERRLDVIEFLQICKVLNTQPMIILHKIETDHE